MARSATLTSSMVPPSPVGADATRRFTLLDPGTFTVGLGATLADGTTMATSLALPVTGDPRAPTITLAQPNAAVTGQLVELSATVVQPGVGPAAGRPVRFTLGGSAVTTSTDESGVAQTTLRAAVAAGDWQVRAEVLSEAGTVVAAKAMTIHIGADQPPVADAGGPYTSNIGDSVSLDASATYDLDGHTVDTAWDLDGDGAYDDATGAMVELEWPTVQQVVCAGACQPDVAYPVAVRGTDPFGSSGEDATTLTFTRDFRVVVSPETLTIVPGTSNTYLVNVASTSGFAGAVQLSIAGLPAGSTSKFVPATVTPGQQSALTVTLPANVNGATTIPFSVTGTSGSLVRTASSVVEVVFGLPPRCSTSAQGTLLDADTGLPVAGALVRFATSDGTKTLTTDGNGHWGVASFFPSTTNQPGQTTRHMEDTGYWTKDDVKATATCGVPLVIEDRLIPIHTVVLSGRAREGTPDSGNATKIVPTGAIAAGTKVTVFNGSTPVVRDLPVDTDGRWEAEVPLSFENKPATYSVQANAPGYWPNSTSSPSAKEGDRPSVDQLIVRQCTARILGGRVLDVRQ